MACDVILACDFSGAEELHSFLSLFEDRRPYLKIGMELFYACGPQIVYDLKERGHSIFLDLKLHDIPNTVKKAMRVLSSLGVDMTNLHASGSRGMMEAALEGLTPSAGQRSTRLIAVTQLTSMSEAVMQSELYISRPLDETVMGYAENAARSGLDGVVCSPLEASKVKKVCGADFLTVTPGVRFRGTDTKDQVRVTDPATARQLGSDYIVVGRPVTQAEDPLGAYLRCMSDFCGR